MERLISLFREAEDDWPLEAKPGRGEEGGEPAPQPGLEPIYFARLMQYLRERNAQGAAAAREGAD